MRRILLVSVVVLLMSPAAMADIISTHYALQDPPAGPSPSPAVDAVTFYNPPELDCFRVGYYSGSFFADPVLNNFISVGPWAQAWGTPTGAVAEGPAEAGVLFDMNFVDLSQGATFLFAGYLGGAYQYSSIISFDANIGGWSVDAYAWDPGKDRPVPEPATWVALLAGMGVLGIIRLRA